MNFKESTPIFMQIANRLCDEIIKDTHLEGERIPSVREYSSLIEVNVNTTMRSYDYLQQQNIIFNKRGIGYFVSEGAKEIIMKIKHDDFINNSLPELFKNMDMLGITLNEISEHYKNR